jgi:uncharacterized protein YbjT (DUF2867 family)
LILVVGASGTVGSAVLAALRSSGADVRAMTRNSARASSPDYVQADLSAPETLPAALDRVRKVFLMSDAPRKAEYEGNFARLARETGVEHIVQLSSLAAVEDPGGTLGRWHVEGEIAVHEVGVPTTVVRANGFMSNALRWAGPVRAEGVVRAPLPHVRSADVDPRDVAAVAVTALLEDGHEGATYNVTGPQPLTPVDSVRILGEVLGRDLRFEEISVAAARAAMVRHIPAEVVDAVLGAREKASEVRARPLPTVKEVTGRPPRTFAEWADDHADVFR